MDADRTTYKGSGLWCRDELLAYVKGGLGAQACTYVGTGLGLVSQQVSRLPTYLAVIGRLTTRAAS
jgi:hypothetical protein